jgi:magnesium-transporting ATPase (P-type)
VAMHLPDSNTVRVYVKGAPEFIVSKCTRTFSIEGEKEPMSEEQLSYILGNIIYENFTSKGYRAMAFAYKDYNLDEFEELRRDSNNFESENDKISLEQNLVFVGVFALQDELRDKVLRSVQYA